MDARHPHRSHGVRAHALRRVPSHGSLAPTRPLPAPSDGPAAPALHHAGRLRRTKSLHTRLAAYLPTIPSASTSAATSAASSGMSFSRALPSTTTTSTSTSSTSTSSSSSSSNNSSDEDGSLGSSRPSPPVPLSASAPSHSHSHHLPHGRFTFASQPLHNPCLDTTMDLAVPGVEPAVRYTFLSAPSSSEDMTQAGDLSSPRRDGPSLDSPFVPARRHAPSSSLHAPRMSGTGGGYGYISGSAESGMSLDESEPGEDYFGSDTRTATSSFTPHRSSPTDDDDDNDPLLALQRLTIDLYEQKHSVPPADELESDSLCESTHQLFTSSSDVSDQGASTSNVTSPRPESTIIDATTPLPYSPGVHPASKGRPSSENGRKTASPTFSDVRQLSLEPAASSTAAPPSNSSHTASPPTFRSSMTPTSPPCGHRHPPRQKSSSPRMAAQEAERDSSQEVEDYQQPHRGAGNKRARQAAATTTEPVAQPASSRRRTAKSRAAASDGTSSRNSRELSPPSRVAMAAGLGIGGAHQTESKMSVCDYVNPLTGAWCGTQFHRLYDLVRHRETVHGREEALEIRKGNLAPDQAVVWGKEVDPATSNVDREWKCNCGSVFSRKDALLRHKRLRGH